MQHTTHLCVTDCCVSMTVCRQSEESTLSHRRPSCCAKADELLFSPWRKCPVFTLFVCAGAAEEQTQARDGVRPRGDRGIGVGGAC